MSTSASTMPAPQGTPFLMVPRDRGDEACALLSPVAFKVWYRITRLTRGWNREEALISYNDFMRACGIKDRHTISSAIKELVAKGFARVVQNIGDAGRKFTSLYALLETPSGNNPLPFPEPTREVVEKIHQGSAVKSTTPSGKNPLVTPRQPTPEVAPQAAIETLIEKERKEEETHSAAGAAQDALPFNDFPIGEDNEDTKPSAAIDSKKERPRDDLWDAAVEVFGYYPQATEHTIWNVTMKKFRAAKLSGEEFVQCCRVYQKKHPTWAFTLVAISKHLGELRHELQKEINGHAKPKAIATYL